MHISKNYPKTKLNAEWTPPPSRCSRAASQPIHLLDVEAFVHLLEVVGFVHLLDVDVVLHLLEVLEVEHLLDAAGLLHLLEVISAPLFTSSE